MAKMAERMAELERKLSALVSAPKAPALAVPPPTQENVIDGLRAMIAAPTSFLWPTIAPDGSAFPALAGLLQSLVIKPGVNREYTHGSRYLTNGGLKIARTGPLKGLIPVRPKWIDSRGITWFIHEKSGPKPSWQSFYKSTGSNEIEFYGWADRNTLYARLGRPLDTAAPTVTHAAPAKRRGRRAK